MDKRGLVWVVVLLGGACNAQAPSRGELGNAQFSWDEGLSCAFGCSASAPVAAGATAGLQVTNYKELGMFTVASDDAAVAEFSSTPGSSYVRVKAQAAGTAKLILSDPSGEVIDRFAIEVRDVARITVSERIYKQRYLIMQGGQGLVEVSPRSADDTELRGVGAISYVLEGGVETPAFTFAGALADLLSSTFSGTNTEYLKVTAKELGAARVVASSAFGANLSIPVEVLDGSTVDRIEVAPQTDFEAGTTISTSADVWIGEERLHAAKCNWTIAPAEGPIQLGIVSVNGVAIKSTGPGKAVITCALGGASGSAEVSAR
jgi:hypothetical protein